MNPQRLTVARQRRGLTKKGFAERIGVSAQIVSDWEAGRKKPSDFRLRQVAQELDFPHGFFHADDLRLPEGDGASFRALSRMTAAQRDSAKAAAGFAADFNEWLERRFLLPKADIPDLQDSPETSAESVRLEWGLGESPVKNMVRLLELRGVRVFSLVEDCVEVDAFSFWDNDTPIILLNTKKSVERSRFDSAHELGHLVLHRHGVPNGRQAEEQANAFASAFLMPRGDVLARSPRLPSIKGIVDNKARWRVSAMAYTRRMRDVGLLSDWHYHQTCRRMAQLGYRKNEPRPMQVRETSRLLEKVFSELRRDGVTQADIGAELLIGRQELNKLVFGLALTGLQGGGRADSSMPSRSRANLRLVDT